MQGNSDSIKFPTQHFFDDYVKQISDSAHRSRPRGCFVGCCVMATSIGVRCFLKVNFRMILRARCSETRRGPRNATQFPPASGLCVHWQRNSAHRVPVRRWFCWAERRGGNLLNLGRWVRWIATSRWRAYISCSPNVFPPLCAVWCFYSESFVEFRLHFFTLMFACKAAGFVQMFLSTKEYIRLFWTHSSSVHCWSWHIIWSDATTGACSGGMFYSLYYLIHNAGLNSMKIILRILIFFFKKDVTIPVGI